MLTLIYHAMFKSDMFYIICISCFTYHTEIMSCLVVRKLFLALPFMRIFMSCCLTTLFNMTDPTYIVMLRIVNIYMLIYMCMCISPCLINSNHVVLLYPESTRY
jgi:hypothetical protein